MKRQIIGVALAAVAVYMWGFLYWGATTIPYLAWQATNDDAAAGQALLEHFPVSGTYYLPGMYNDEETRNKLSDAGPVGFVHIQREGRPVVDTSTMRNGFLLMLATAFLISVILKRALPALPSYADRVGFVALLGLTAVVMIDCGDAVWWNTPWGWKVYQIFYDLVAWVIAGLVLAKFVRPETAATE